MGFQNLLEAPGEIRITLDAIDVEPGQPTHGTVAVSGRGVRVSPPGGALDVAQKEPGGRLTLRIMAREIVAMTIENGAEFDVGGWQEFAGSHAADAPGLVVQNLP